MGSLMMAGAIEGLGTGMKENVVRKTEDRRRQEDKDYELQLANMRMEFEREQAGAERKYQTSEREAEQEYTTEAADILFGRESGEAETAHKRELELKGKELSSEEAIATQTNQTRLDVALIDAYTAETKSGRVSVKGWDISTTNEQVFDPETGAFELMPVIHASYGGRTWRQIGDMMFDAGGPTQPKTQWKSLDAKLEAENALIKGDVTPEIFNAEHGYLPTRFVSGLATQAPSVMEWLKTNRMPVHGSDLPPPPSGQVAPIEGGNKPTATTSNLLTQGQGWFNKPMTAEELNRLMVSAESNRVSDASKANMYGQMSHGGGTGALSRAAQNRL
jgi:hypothetical protein